MIFKETMSIATRIALLFAGATGLIFITIGAYLYQALGDELDRRTDTELIGKFTLIRHLLKESTSVAEIERSPNFFLDALIGHKGLSLRISRPNGTMILQNISIEKVLPRFIPLPLDKQPNSKDIRSYKPDIGSGRILEAMGATSDSEQVHIVLAREGTEKTELLQNFQQTLIIAILLGTGLTMIFGIIIVRSGLHPLEIIISKANDITAQHLNTRLSVHGSPHELQKLGTAFNSMLDRLEDSVQRLSRFSADLAHDLRTPINTLMMQTQVALTRSRPQEEYQTLLASNIEEYERLARMIENTLFLARADNAQLAVNWENLTVKVELQRIHDYFEGLAEDKDVSITINAEDISIKADRVLFQRAISNVLTNAVHHTQRGGYIRVSAKAEKNVTEVIIENSGAGIAPEHLPHIFERYYRGDASRQELTHSTGLGLAIVRAIMHLHGGEVDVRSMVNQSTTFRLRFML